MFSTTVAGLVASCSLQSDQSGHSLNTGVFKAPGELKWSCLLESVQITHPSRSRKGTKQEKRCNGALGVHAISSNLFAKVKSLNLFFFSHGTFCATEPGTFRGVRRQRPFGGGQGCCRPGGGTTESARVPGSNVYINIYDNTR